MDPPPTPLNEIPTRVRHELERLHKLSKEQEVELHQRRSHRFVSGPDAKPDAPHKATFDALVRDKMIALDQDKCHFVYHMARAIKARNIIEAGTGYGVSTVYLAFAVSANVADHGGAGVVVATENEKSKAAAARTLWECYCEGASTLIDLRVGDVLETLKEEVSDVEMLLLDIWSPLALPILRLVAPHMRTGGVVITDNTVASAENYKELLDYLRSPESGFSTMTIPFDGGLGFSVKIAVGQPATGNWQR